MKVNEDQYDEMEKLKEQVQKFDKSKQEFEHANEILEKQDNAINLSNDQMLMLKSQNEYLRN